MKHGRWTKTAVAVVLAILQALATVLLGGLETNDWITLVIAGLGAAGVLAAPATSVNPDGSVQKFKVSGEPMFGPACQFLGYRGIGVELKTRH